MPKGGARNRSGPQADPKSLRSAKRDLTYTALPAEGYSGEAPAWPLAASALDDMIGAREQDIWTEAWRTPQACAWAWESWRWPIVAEYCRLKAVIEVTASSNATQVGQLHRYRDQIGLTPAGLKENGWAIAADETAERRVKPAEKRASARDRLKVVNGDGG